MSDQRAKIALFGTNSTGKTLQIKTLIDALGGENVGIISAEDGLSTIASCLSDQHVKAVSKLSEFETALAWGAQNYTGAAQFLCIDGGTRVFEWNAGKIWDASDEAYEQMLFMRKTRNQLDGIARFGSRFITGQGEIDGYAQWKEIGNQAEILSNKILATRCNIYMNFQEDESQLPDRKKGLPYTVDAPGKASREAVYRMFDFIFRLTYSNGAPTAIHDRDKSLARTKARDDWGGGIKVEASMCPFRLSEFFARLNPKPLTLIATNAKESA